MSFRFARNFSFWILLPIIIVFFAAAKGWPEIIISILIVITLSIILIFILAHLFPLTIKKSKYRKNISLYQWMDDLDDYEERLMYSLKKCEVKYSTIENLKSLKNTIVKLSKNDKSTLKLYRAFYNQKSAESGEELYLKTILVSVIPLTGLVFKDKLLIFEEQQLIYYFWQIFVIFIILAFISMRLGINKKRNGMMIEVINLCIEEIEDEEKRIAEECV